MVTAVLAGCEVVEPVTRLGTEVAVHSGAITRREAEAINRSTAAVVKTFEDITPEQEYYIGRSVAAIVLSKYPPYNNQEATYYVNLLGQTLAAASDQPETFGGYHFLILDSPEINAFAAPGGLILITRGMLALCKTEDALAAVLAHEIGHVQGQHGLRAIKRGRLTAALTILAAESAKTFGGADLAELTEAFEGSLSDITSTLMNNGYSRELEREADTTAVKLLKRVGYNPRALTDMLGEMKKRLKPGGLDFARTHPDPADRIAEIRPLVAGSPEVAAPPARQARFEKVLKGI
jgi:predicted Zn-dependent protease